MKTHRLDQLLATALGDDHHPRDTHQPILDGSVKVDGETIPSPSARVPTFCTITLGGETVYHRVGRYLALHKPAGYLSATRDEQHPTVLDLITEGVTDDLHLAGRLDRATTGLVLLTNDSSWSKHLAHPDSRVPKVYLVETADDIDPASPAAFQAGLTLPGDGAPKTLPSELEILAPRRARLTLHEGRHHQIKRMFALDDNRVVSLHRESIGNITLEGIAEGAYRELPPPM